MLWKRKKKNETFKYKVIDNNTKEEHFFEGYYALYYFLIKNKREDLSVKKVKQK